MESDWRAGMSEAIVKDSSNQLLFSFAELRFIVRNIGKGHSKKELVDMFAMRKTCDEMKKVIFNGSSRIERRVRSRKNRIGQSQSGSQGG